MNTRCKFKCDLVNDDGETQSITLTPVYCGSKENEDFFKYTPAGELKLYIVNKNVKFEIGKEYFLDISETN